MPATLRGRLLAFAAAALRGPPRRSVAYGGGDFAEAQMHVIIVVSGHLGLVLRPALQSCGALSFSLLCPVYILWRKACVRVTCVNLGIHEDLNMFWWQRFGDATLRMPRL